MVTTVVKTLYIIIALFRPPVILHVCVRVLTLKTDVQYSDGAIASDIESSARISQVRQSVTQSINDHTLRLNE